MPDQSDNPKVTYDVATLLDGMGTRLDSGFAKIIERLDNKADKSDLAAINATLAKHGDEISTIKSEMRDAQVAETAKREYLRLRWTVREKALALGTGMVIAAGSIYGLVAR